MSKHTPGPWHWVNSQTDEPFDFDAQWDGEGYPSLRTVAEHKTQSVGTLPEWILDAEPLQHGNDAANARLIAAAPDLAETCEAMERALIELVALVRGECPSLLNEDSGGSARLSIAVDIAIAVSSAALRKSGVR